MVSSCSSILPEALMRCNNGMELLAAALLLMAKVVDPTMPRAECGLSWAGSVPVGLHDGDGDRQPVHLAVVCRKRS